VFGGGSGLGGFDITLKYLSGNESIVQVFSKDTSVSPVFSMIYPTDGSAQNTTSATPDVTINSKWDATELDVGGTAETGEGVLLRTNMKALAAGTVSLTLDDRFAPGSGLNASIYDPLGNAYTVNHVVGATIVVGGSCGSTTPSPSGTITATPSPTPTPTPTPSGSITATPTPSPTPTPTTSGSITDTPTPTPTTSGSITDTPTPTPTTSGSITDTPTPTPTPTVSSHPVQGDFSCNGQVGGEDLVLALKGLGGLPQNLSQACIALGQLGAQISGKPWGDLNCDGVVDILDVLFLLAHLGGIEMSQPTGCFAIGSPMN
jgi:hypothetical protein